LAERRAAFARLAVSLRSLNREPWFETARIVESILLAVNPIRPFA